MQYCIGIFMIVFCLYNSLVAADKEVCSFIDSIRHEPTQKEVTKFKELVRNVDVHQISENGETLLGKCCWRVYFICLNTYDYMIRYLKVDTLAIPFNDQFVHFLIEKGSLLMVKTSQKRWNSFDDIYIGFKDLKSTQKIVGYLEQNTKMLLYSKFKHDYKVYCKKFLLVSLIFKRFKAEKKCVMPKVLINYISNMVAQDPTAHIEEALKDVQEYHFKDFRTFEKNLPNKCVKRLMNPQQWKENWLRFKGRDHQESNLIVQALGFIKVQYSGRID